MQSPLQEFASVKAKDWIIRERPTWSPVGKAGPAVLSCPGHRQVRRDGRLAATVCFNAKRPVLPFWLRASRAGREVGKEGSGCIRETTRGGGQKENTVIPAGTREKAGWGDRIRWVRSDWTLRFQVVGWHMREGLRGGMGFCRLASVRTQLGMLKTVGKEMRIKGDCHSQEGSRITRT